MRHTVCFCLIVLFANSTSAQTQKYGAWFFTSGCSRTTVNGLGLTILSGGWCDQDNYQVTNGIQLDILGRGIIPPIIYTTLEELEVFRDTLLVHQRINGLAISPGGVAFLGTVMNGINLFGISTMTGQINGISAGLILNYNLRVNGVTVSVINVAEIRMDGLQIGGLNATGKMKGLQIGLFNAAEDLKGVQIGLWNKSEKRALPFLNFQF